MDGGRNDRIVFGSAGVPIAGDERFVSWPKSTGKSCSRARDEPGGAGTGVCQVPVRRGGRRGPPCAPRARVSLPRRLLPDRTYSTTRRTARRVFFLTPSPETNAIVRYALGAALMRHPRIALFAFLAHVNHIHAVLGDRGDAREPSQLPAFKQYFHSLVARALNARFGRGENLWSTGSYGAVELHGRESQEQQLLYCWTNPTLDGQVAHPDQWTGTKFMPEDFGRTITVEKPAGAFFGGRRPAHALERAARAADGQDGDDVDTEAAGGERAGGAAVRGQVGAQAKRPAGGRAEGVPEETPPVGRPAWGPGDLRGAELAREEREAWREFTERARAERARARAKREAKQRRGTKRRRKKVAEDKERRRRKAKAKLPKTRPPRPPRVRTTLPDSVSFVIEPPPGFEGRPAEATAHYRKLLDAEVERIDAVRREAGFTRYMGVAAVEATDPLEAPGDTWPSFGLKPRIACKDKEQRIELLQGLRAWRKAMHDARLRWSEGDREVVFPRGAYAIWRFHAARVEGVTPAAVGGTVGATGPPSAA